MIITKKLYDITAPQAGVELGTMCLLLAPPRVAEVAFDVRFDAADVASFSVAIY